MARVTVEDTLKKIPNHFDLVMVAAIVARQLSKAHDQDSRPHKPTVTALQKIENGEVGVEILETLAT